MSKHKQPYRGNSDLNQELSDQRVGKRDDELVRTFNDSSWNFGKQLPKLWRRGKENIGVRIN